MILITDGAGEGKGKQKGAEEVAHRGIRRRIRSSRGRNDQIDRWTRVLAKNENGEEDWRWGRSDDFPYHENFEKESSFINVESRGVFENHKDRGCFQIMIMRRRF